MMSGFSHAGPMRLSAVALLDFAVLARTSSTSLRRLLSPALHVSRPSSRLFWTLSSSEPAQWSATWIPRTDCESLCPCLSGCWCWSLALPAIRRGQPCVAIIEDAWAGQSLSSWTGLDVVTPSNANFCLTVSSAPGVNSVGSQNPDTAMSYIAQKGTKRNPARAIGP